MEESLFEGESVRLRSLELSDVPLIMKHWNNINLRKELGPVVPHSSNEREMWVRQTWKEREQRTAFVFAIETRKDRYFLGHCALKNVRWINRSAIVSIAIYNKSDRGKGYGTDALKVLLRVGFDFLNLHRIALNVFHTNKQALHVYEKIGFKKVGELRETDFVDGKYVNDVIMDMLEEDYRQLYHTKLAKNCLRG